mmetsp:Transcript_8396/g.20114  ORF Transcript_8396/g.20114 Transcript_8396/m.20114 type:complete len:295 (-) Transcript_8396:35-919(-)
MHRRPPLQVHGLAGVQHAGVEPKQVAHRHRRVEAHLIQLDEHWPTAGEEVRGGEGQLVRPPHQEAAKDTPRGVALLRHCDQRVLQPRGAQKDVPLVGERGHGEKKLRRLDQLGRGLGGLGIDGEAQRALLRPLPRRLARLVTLAAHLERLRGGRVAFRQDERVDGGAAIGERVPRDEGERRAEERLVRPRGARAHRDLHRRLADPRDCARQLHVVLQVGAVAVDEALDDRRHQQQVGLSLRPAVLERDRAGESVEVFEQTAGPHVAPRARVRILQLRVVGVREAVDDGGGGVGG